MAYKKPQICYSEFILFKNRFLQDPDPLEPFGRTFCKTFGVDDERVLRTKTVAEARVAINDVVEWVI